MKTRMLDSFVSGVKLRSLAGGDHKGPRAPYKLSMNSTPKRYISKAPIGNTCQFKMFLAAEVG